MIYSNSDNNEPISIWIWNWTHNWEQNRWSLRAMVALINIQMALPSTITHKNFGVNNIFAANARNGPTNSALLNNFVCTHTSTLRFWANKLRSETKLFFFDCLTSPNVNFFFVSFHNAVFFYVIQAVFMIYKLISTLRNSNFTVDHIRLPFVTKSICVCMFQLNYIR